MFLAQQPQQDDECSQKLCEIASYGNGAPDVGRQYADRLLMSSCCLRRQLCMVATLVAGVQVVCKSAVLSRAQRQLQGLGMDSKDADK